MEITAPTYSPGQPQPRPYVRFETRPVLDNIKSTETGEASYQDQTWVVLMAPGSRDTVEKSATDWLLQLEQQAKAGRIPAEWPRQYKDALKEWEAGNVLPEDGTPLRLWPALTPAQVQNCARANILTVENLADANAEALTRIGMGAIHLKQLAQAWKQEASSTGTLLKRLETALVQAEALQARIADLEKANQLLQPKKGA